MVCKSPITFCDRARNAFMKKWCSFEGPYHHDEIYSISLSMRK